MNSRIFAVMPMINAGRCSAVNLPYLIYVVMVRTGSGVPKSEPGHNVYGRHGQTVYR